MTGIYSARHTRLHRTGFDADPVGKITIEPTKDWYSHKEVERILGVKRMTVHRAIHSGALQAESIGGVYRAGKWRISHEALIAFIEAGQKRPR